jgi:hypothetical protein
MIAGKLTTDESGLRQGTWAVRLLTAILVALIGMGLPALYGMGGLRAEVSHLAKVVQNLTKNVGQINVDLAKIESAEMKPAVREGFNKLDERIRVIEINSASK